MERTRKLKPFEELVTLSNGDVAIVRALTVLDYARTGQIPDVDEDPKPVRGRKRKTTQKDYDNLELMLTRGVVAYFRGEDGYGVVGKDPHECGETELSIVGIPDHIQTELVNAITRASGVPDLGPFSGGEGGGRASSDYGGVPEDETGPDPGDGSENIQLEQEDPGAIPGDREAQK